jgi:predicted alpha/beta-fold hydrolase
MRNQEDFPRAQRLWQPMLAETLREDFLLGKWGRRVLTAIPREHFYKMIRATHVTEIDRYAVVSYNNYDDLDHYYRSMSALGDIPHLVDGTLPIQNSGKIHSLSIPLAVVQSLDDPLVTWRATVNNDGFMHPTNLIESGDGNLMIVLTKKGGHVGWPTGLFPFIDKWKWMSNAAGSFGVAVDAAKKYKLRQD